MRNFLKKILATAGYDVRRIGIPKRDDPYEEKKALLSGITEPIIFDVGANVGNMVLKYKELFPESQLHAFEPFEKSYQQLQQRCSNLNGIHLNHVGVANISGTRSFHCNQVASTNSLLPASNDGLATKGGERFKTREVVQVALTTLDEYTASQNIKRIDLLKIDVQGAEPQVLEGSRLLLERGAIHLIFTEIMVTNFYEGQQLLHEALAMYDRLGFRLYNFYDLSAFEGPLRQLDAIFVRK